jgi:hypothetical protein
MLLMVFFVIPSVDTSVNVRSLTTEGKEKIECDLYDPKSKGENRMFISKYARLFYTEINKE